MPAGIAKSIPIYYITIEKNSTPNLTFFQITAIMVI